jgi:predicted transglutaminase-like cysteine proteinase
MTTWGKKDYWATLCEVLGSDRADCEDYVIVKFFLLKMLGIDTSKLYFTHVKATKYKFSSHLVLTYYPTYDAIPYVLDNLNQKVLPATARNDLVVLGTYSSDDLNNVAHSPLGKKLRAAAQQEKPFNDLGIKLSPP